jgi:uncharacterized membrane protein
MTYLQFLLVVHVVGAIIGFGSTFAFAFFPQGETRLAPGVRATLAEISFKISSRFSVPVAFFIQPFTGALMIFETGRNQDFFSHTWLWIALGLYLILISIFTFVAFPDTRHEYEMTREGREPDPNYRPRGNAEIYGPLLGVLIVAIAILMVWKPGD